ncbi:MAG: ABC transporter ATP-binding protein [Clostridia bacterium]
MLKIKNLSKTYKNGKKAVDSLNIEVSAGDIYGFIGHNGAGKTTTIKCVAGILQFDQGEILIDGISMAEKPLECKAKIAYLSDSPNLYEHMKGVSYLNFIADVFGIPQKEREERIQTFADRLELTNQLDGLISSYSHGMKQKLALISAFIHAPKLIILDEPFVGLDPKAAHSLKEMLKEHCALGNAVFFSTHVLEVAEKLCNKIAIIRDGKLVVSGATDEVKGDNTLEEMFLELIEHE